MMFPDIKFPPTKVDWLIADFVKKDKPTIADFMRLRTIGGLFDSLDNFRVNAKHMTPEQLESEQHKSNRLGRYRHGRVIRAHPRVAMLMQ